MDKCWGNRVVVIEVDEGFDWGLPRKCIMDKCWGSRVVVIEWTKDSIGICQENVSSFAALAFVYKETLIYGAHHDYFTNYFHSNVNDDRTRFVQRVTSEAAALPVIASVSKLLYCLRQPFPIYAVFERAFS
jgi:hypothetical protein